MRPTTPPWLKSLNFQVGILCRLRRAPKSQGHSDQPPTHQSDGWKGPWIPEPGEVVACFFEAKQLNQRGHLWERFLLDYIGFLEALYKKESPKIRDQSNFFSETQLKFGIQNFSLLVFTGSQASKNGRRTRQQEAEFVMKSNACKK